MVSPAMGAAMMGTMHFLRANCVQHGGKASGGGLISASLLKLQGSKRKYEGQTFQSLCSTLRRRAERNYKTAIHNE